MKTLLAAIALFSSLSASADVIKMFDGTVAKCESRADVATQNISGSYRLVSLDQLGHSGQLKIEFLSCVETNGKFKFVRDLEFQNKLVNSAFDPSKRIHIERSKVIALVTSDSGNLVSEVSFKQDASGVYSAAVNLESCDGLILNVLTLFRLTDVQTGAVIDQGRETYGAFRIQ